jgi:hypothetical protein
MCFSISSFSKNVELQIKMTLKKGSEVQTSETIVIAKLGKSWEIPFTDDKSFKMKMNATDKFEIPSEVKKHYKHEIKSDLMISGKVFIKEDGKEKLIATPLIISNYKAEAILEVETDNGELFEMKITPVLKL